MAGPAQHVISREVECQIFRRSCIFRCTCIYKQPKMTKLWNYNIFVQVLYSYLTSTIIGFSMCFSCCSLQYYQGFMRRKEEKIKLQKKEHRRICEKGITFLAAGALFYVIFLSLFSSTQILHRKKFFPLGNVGRGVPMSSPQCLRT